MSNVNKKKPCKNPSVNDALDPVSVLSPQGIAADNKHDIGKLADVLASFGDFRDACFRTRIRKDEAEQIQAIAYLLKEAAAASSAPQKRKAVEEDACGKPGEGENDDEITIAHFLAKRRRTIRDMSGENIQGDTEIAYNSPPRTSGHPSIQECDTPTQRRSGSRALPHSSVQRESEVHSMSENVLGLHGLADYSEADGTVAASSDFHLQAGVSEKLSEYLEDGEIYQNSDSNSSATAFSSQSYHQFPAALPMESATSTSLSKHKLKAPESVARFTPPEDWLLDETIPPQSIQNIVVSVSGTAAFPNAWFDGKYEGKRARVLSVLNTGKLETSLALVTMLDSHSGYLSELRIPVHFLVPVPPEAIGDEIVVLRVPSEKIQELSEHVGTRWEVRALGLREDDADEDASDGAGDLVELDSEIGQMRLHRSCLALYSP